MAQPNTRHYFVVDSNGTKVAAIDDSTISTIDLKDGHTIDNTPILDVASDKAQSLDKLTSASVNWDSHYE